MKLKHIIALISAAVLLCGVFTVSAVSPYPNYEYTTDNYNSQIGSKKSDANARIAPDAYVYRTSINQMTLKGLEIPFNTPEDFICDDQGNIYVSDPANKRIVVIDSAWQNVIAVLTAWHSTNGEMGDFAAARGLFLKSNILYVCLQDKGQILKIDLATMELPLMTNEVTVGHVINAPDLSSVSDNFSFKPTKLVVDQSQRMYIIVQGAFDGLVSLDDNGDFLGYVGANRIQLSLWERFWRSISTTEQIDASADNVPVEYYGMDIDDEGFIYTTSKGNPTENVVRRLNLIGNDVLKTGTHYIKGELSPLRKEGIPGAESNLIDIDVRKGGIYTCLDNVRGRVFTYDHEGNLLFVFGGISYQKGAFTVPSAVQWSGDEILVLDKGANEISVFSPTTYGNAVIEAAISQYKGEYGDSWDKWEQVLSMNPNNEIANRSAGKLAYDGGDYKKAMQYFRTANDTALYSKAYIKHRAEIIAGIIPYAAIGIGFIILIFVLWRIIRALRASRDRFEHFKAEARKFNERRVKGK